MSKQRTAEIIINIGKKLAKLELNTNSPLVHHQGVIPRSLEKMREEKNK